MHVSHHQRSVFYGAPIYCMVMLKVYLSLYQQIATNLQLLARRSDLPPHSLTDQLPLDQY